MNNFVQKILNRYISSWIVLMIDTMISVFSTIVVMVLLHPFIGGYPFTMKVVGAIIIASTIFSLVNFLFFRSYRGVIRYASLRVLWRLVVAVVGKSLLLGAFYYGVVFYNSIVADASVGSRLAVAVALDITLTISLLIAARLLMIAVYDYVKSSIRHQRRVNTLIYGNWEDNSATIYALGEDPIGGTPGNLTYGALVDFWSQFDPYTMNTLLVSNDVMLSMLKMPEFQNPLTGLNFQGTGTLTTPLGAKLLRTSALGSGKLIGLDKNFALEQICGSEISVEYDKLIDRQLERAAITSISGFAKLFGDASRVLTV